MNQFSSIQKQKFHIFLRDRKVEVIWRCYNHVFKHYQRQRNKTQDTFVRHLFQQHMVWYLCWKHPERSLKIFILKVREFSLVFFLSFYFFYNIIFFFICRIEKKGIKVSPVVFFFRLQGQCKLVQLFLLHTAQNNQVQMMSSYTVCRCITSTDTFITE